LENKKDLNFPEKEIMGVDRN